MIRSLLLMIFTSCFFFSLNVTAQNKRISGTVTAKENGKPLIGVTVIQQGTKNFTTTDFEGRYSIEIPLNANLLFIFYGFKPLQKVVGSDDIIDVVIKTVYTPISSYINDYTIAVEEKTLESRLGYAIDAVSTNDLLRSQEQNVAQALNGKVAGLLVNASNGAAGAPGTLNLRGYRSIYGDNSPLIILDGVPIDNNSFSSDDFGVSSGNRLLDINTHDIANVNVLKGPIASVLYGSRAANGVLMIETHKGEAGAVKVNFATTARMDQVNQLPALQNTWSQGLPNTENGSLRYTNPTSGNPYSWGPLLSNLEFDGDTDYPYDVRGNLVPLGTGSGVSATAYDNANTMLRNSFSFDNNLNISGGGDKYEFYFSAGDNLINGIVPGNNARRSSFRTNLAVMPNEALKVNLSGAYSRFGNNQLLQGNSGSAIMSTLIAPRSFDVAAGYTNPNDAIKDIDAFILADGSQRSFDPANFDNPFWTLNQSSFENRVDRIFGLVGFEYAVSDELHIRYKLGLDYLNDRNNYLLAPGSAAYSGGNILDVSRTSNKLNSDIVISYSKEVSDELEINTLLGHNFFSSTLQNDLSKGSDLEPLSPDYEGAQYKRDTTTNVGRNINGIFANLNIGYNRHLYFDLALRNDFYEFFDHNASYLYPAASMSFVINELVGMGDSEVFPFGQIRAGWGKAGNDGGEMLLNRLSGLGNTGMPKSYGLDNNPLVGSRSDLPVLGWADDLRPEITTSIELGADFRFFENKIGLDFTYFDQTTTDMIVMETSDEGASVVGSNFLNGGEMSTNGFEIDFHLTPVQTNAFSWYISTNFARWNNSVVSLPEGIEEQVLGGVGGVYTAVRSGQVYGGFYGSDFQRHDDGRLIIGQDGWPLVSQEADYLGKASPDWFAAARNTLNFGNFSISALFDFRSGNQVWNGTEMMLRAFGMSAQTESARDIKGFVFDGVVNTGTEENPNYEDNNIAVDFYDPSRSIEQNRWLRYGSTGVGREGVMNASWVRLRELTIGMSLPSELLANSAFRNVDFYLSGRNLWLKTPYQGIDPETSLFGASNAQGFDLFNIANTRSYSFTLSFSL